MGGRLIRLGVRTLGAAALALVALGSCTTLTDFAARSFFLPKDDRKAEYAVETLHDQGFVTTDGVRLNAEVHRPKGLLKTPTLLSRIPYSDTAWNRLRSDSIARYWAAHGYTVVVQGTRGRFHSGGAFQPLTHEREDGQETLAWIAKQPWYDGHIGMWGGSAFGQTIWAVYDNAEPNVDTAFIQIASTSFRDFFHPGGAFALESALYWSLNSHGTKDEEVDYKALDKGVQGFPVIEADDRALAEIPFFDDWAGQDPAYWRKVDGADRAKNSSAPMLMLGGWYDPFLSSMLRDYAEMKRNAKAADTKLIIGPFGHARGVEIFGKPGPEYRIASVDPALRWFDERFGIAGSKPLAPVRIFVMGENVWRDEQEWPLARTRFEQFHMWSDGKLHDGAMFTGDAKLGFTYDPQDPVPTNGGAMLGARSGMKLQAKEARKDVLSFLSEPLAQPMEITGPVNALLTVKTDAPSTDFTVKLCVVLADGTAWNLADGIARMAMPPNFPRLYIDVDMGAVSILLPQGSRLRVDVSSSNFPRFDRNPNTGENPETARKTRIARQTLFLSEAVGVSYVTLPVIPR